MVIYLAGAQRSGTTLLAQMLTEVDNSVLIGELRPIFDSASPTAVCDCGSRRDTCAFWSCVDGESPELSAAGRVAYRLTNLPRLLLALKFPSLLRASDQLVVQYLEQIASAAGARRVIDASKSPLGIVLWRHAGQQVAVLQCYRSLFAVVQAQRQPSRRSGLPMHTRRRTAAAWLTYHAAAFVLRPLASSLSRVYYQRLLRAPRAELLRICRELELPLVLDPLATREFEIHDSHVRSGNPRRAKARQISVRCPRRTLVARAASQLGRNR